MARPSDRFRQPFSYAPVASRDARGQPSLGARVDGAWCRAEPFRRLMEDAQGNGFTSEWQLFTAAPVDVDFRVWPPGTDATRPELGRRVRKVTSFPDGDGVEAYRELIL